MQMIESTDCRIAVRSEGPKAAPVLLMAHGLGLDSGAFDPVVPPLGRVLRVVRYDARGHGASEVPPAPYPMGRIVGDAEAVCEGLGLRDVTFLGHGMGGLAAIGLAVKRPELVRALVLSNTAARIGTGAVWDRRIDAVRARGPEDLAGDTAARWFAPGFTDTADWAARLAATPPEGYVGHAAALAGADLREVASGLRLPVLCIAGSHDRETPPDLVRETADTIPGARFALLRRAGHLPFVDHPEAFTAAVAGFLSEIETL